MSAAEFWETLEIPARHDTNTGCLDSVPSATTGRAGVDVATAVEVTLLDTKVHCIPSNMKGPLGHGLCAILLGLSSTSRQGISVLPGVIDADYTGVIVIMVQTITPPVNIAKGARIAQLVPFESRVPKSGKLLGGDAGFGSSGSPAVLLALNIQKSKPEETVRIMGPKNETIVLKMILDTGADVTVIPRRQPILKLRWKTETPVWVDQWPLNAEKLSKIQELVQEQLEAGHIVPSTSPWNTPIFTIPKKNGKWHMLHDLRVINAVMHDMGALQPGLPSPVMIPVDWNIFIIDLKDCFFTILLHPEDQEKFAFTVPSINKAEPARWYQWTVLPQGMKNSPTMCQHFVAWALKPIRERFAQFLIYHYMDDILIAGENTNSDQVLKELIPCLEKKRLKVAPEKIQKSSSWNYLGWVITDTQVRPQKITLKMDIPTLNDAQKLVGDIQWIRNLFGVSNEDLALLLRLLSTSTNVDDKRQLSVEQTEDLQCMMDKIVNSKAAQYDPDLLIQLIVINGEKSSDYPFALFAQWDPALKDPL
ncbi:PREDICTED: LOW QUALITY PROTEIN: endogenous retrovirus group K member 11 Pol protein-like [Haliaeetus leucocephalus]|uniref:LOW QUALITY PROTEIN: endogenous retrovirus group K member 11 Pol protein-like n=1 Tax=Haliaeetus leucocephalus TaxID=52644 RepID=UPI00053CD13A|nr:PREDICTED: LOW QUALITY PROTEIN: endogenous retrovirus group K member 11 Pol protein-like [Haliaeetus leucocephalus]